MTKREFLDTVFALAPNEANAIMDAFDEYVESNETHWIPVAERLPEVSGLYLVSVKNDHKRKYSKTAWFEKGTWFARQDVVERYIDGKLDSKGIYLEEDDGYWRCLFDTGAILMTFAYPKEQFKKTGKHYDIASILEAMRE